MRGMSAPTTPRRRLLDPDRPGFLVGVLLLIGGSLAVSSLLGDSLTFDELDQMTGGVSYWHTGDFRLSPGNPPFAKMWATLPLYLFGSRWRDPSPDLWRESKLWRIGHAWLFPGSAGEDLVTRARLAMLAFYAGVVLTCYAAARRIFGGRAGLLAAAVAALSPEMLAHGRLVTTDLPVTCLFALCLYTFARLAERVTLPRFLASAASLGALSLTKFSWPLVIPAMLVIAIAALARARGSRTASPAPGGAAPPALAGVDAPCGHANPPGARFCTVCGRPMDAVSTDATGPGGCAPAAPAARGPLAHAALLGVASLLVGAFVWAAIWSCYQWRFSPFRDVARGEATMFAVAIGQSPAPTTMDGAWETILKDPEGRELGGLTAGFVRAARSGRWLPEAYLYGLATVLRPSAERSHYLFGETYSDIRAAYFAWTVLLKTPLATMALIAAGGVALGAWGRRRVGDVPLLAGLVTFVVLYALYASFRAVNIGHRHILPIYPALYVLASAVAGGAAPVAGRWIGAALAVWLGCTTALAHPHYLSYFNEAAGGWRNGWRYLADSNIDWGQDLKRLAAYARAHPGERIKLAYFGSAKPDQYGIPVEMLMSTVTFGAPAKLEPGTFAVSVTQALGVYPSAAAARDAFWADERNRTIYRRARELFATPPDDDAAAQNRQRLQRGYDGLRQGRLLNQLRRREPDERIGASIWIYRLTKEDIDALTAPP